MYISIDVDIDEIVNENTEEVTKALSRNGHDVCDMAEVLDTIKEIRRSLTTLIRTLEE